MTPMVACAATAITTALVMYTIGVFAQRRTGTLHPRHLVLFVLGLLFDGVGTTIMSAVAGAQGTSASPLHAASGVAALALMALHTIWAGVILWRRKRQWVAGFHRFSVVVWLFWLVPYVIGMLLGIPVIALSDTAVTVAAVAVVAVIALALAVAEGALDCRVDRKSLLLVAGIVWVVAGANVMAIGVGATRSVNSSSILVVLGLIAAGVAVFTAFHTMFGRLLVRNAARIRALEAERHAPWRFLDLRGWIVMSVMIALGFGLRATGMVPGWFFAFFYTGLGAALALTGVGFLMHRVQGAGWTFHRSRQAA
ncbi:TIGR03987 family protein [Schaalia sp. 19OD2882]|uniref:HsmA family protein n=1 Tax=Schaalia sp. 19OD2882 TaxID=2794089 RepID=UPI001C1EFACB|nr:HsmA family protein [Schaalia sp. 19OD2882]QWW20038.1 TIGR03987 family protein [Schaalia sp. 19OD2882]